MSHDLSTAEGRALAKSYEEGEIKKLEEQIEPFSEKIDALNQENKDKLQARYSVESKIGNLKKGGTALIAVGAIAIVATLLFLRTNPVVLALGILAGIAAIAIGIVVLNKRKNHYPERERVDESLRDYDKKVAELRASIGALESEISKHKSVIREINEKEVYAKVDEWIERTAVGHVGVYATWSNDFSSSKPVEPSCKRYSLRPDAAEVYINEMCYGSVTCNTGLGNNRTFNVFEVDETGTQKVEVYVGFSISGQHFVKSTAPVPVKFDKGSKFYWCHLSTTSKGTGMFTYSFDNLTDLMEATGITKKEILNSLIKD